MILFSLQSCVRPEEGTDGLSGIQESRNDPRALLPTALHVRNDPLAEAARATAIGDYRLVQIDYGWYRTVPAIRCVLYPVRDEDVRYRFNLDSAASKTVVAAVEQFARRYNRAVFQAPGYPDYDICRLSEDGWIDAKPTQSDLADFMGWKGDPSRQGERHSVLTASRFGHLEALNDMPAAPAQLNSRDEWGMAPLDWAAARANPEMAEHLLEKGANVQPFADIGASSIHWAVMSGQPEILKLLTQRLADDVNGCRYLDLVASPFLKATELNRARLLELLLAAGSVRRDCERFADLLREAVAIARTNNHAVLERWLLEQSALR